MGAFNNQFTPVDGGYLYYPSKNSGGKLVTADEYEQLAAGWRKVAGRRGMWKIVGIVMLAIIFWTTISKSLSLPEWSDSIMVAASVAGISAWLLWASRSEEHTSELQSLMRISYAVFCLKKKKHRRNIK